ncbi:MAG: tRNA (adenosine(37)-N6)-threonylcarbamoyltransferase complex transferase subunit TsaD [Pseudomonadota bacterium]
MVSPAENQATTVLGIETSCDETAAAVVVRAPDGSGTIASNIIRSQWAEHAAYGGVVPEIAARAHLACLDTIIEQALRDADRKLSNVHAIAATAGPGLIGGLMVGLTVAKAMAIATSKPLLAINHLEAHALTVGLTDQLRPPYLLLLVSGGHTQTVLVEAIGRYKRLGSTIDDALGEAFDKTAKLLGLEAPGGPAVERMAELGDSAAFAFPRPMRGRPEPHFSFAGLKTAVRRTAQKLVPLSDSTVSDLCASFEAAVCDCVVDRCERALADARAHLGERPALVVAGGVAANKRLRRALQVYARDAGVRLVVPPPRLCADNAAMVAWAASERLARGMLHDGLTQSARARWPLDELADPVLGTGQKGAKA